jgi:hypothetical protein
MLARRTTLLFPVGQWLCQASKMFISSTETKISISTNIGSNMSHERDLYTLFVEQDIIKEDIGGYTVNSTEKMLYNFSVVVSGPPVFVEGMGSLLRDTPWIANVYGADTKKTKKCPLEAHLIGRKAEETLQKKDICLLFSFFDAPCESLPAERHVIFADSLPCSLQKREQGVIEKGRELGIKVFLSMQDDVSIIRRGIFAAIEQEEFYSSNLARYPTLRRTTIPIPHQTFDTVNSVDPTL